MQIMIAAALALVIGIRDRVCESFETVVINLMNLVMMRSGDCVGEHMDTVIHIYFVLVMRGCHRSRDAPITAVDVLIDRKSVV